MKKVFLVLAVSLGTIAHAYDTQNVTLKVKVGGTISTVRNIHVNDPKNILPANLCDKIKTGFYSPDNPEVCRQTGPKDVQLIQTFSYDKIGVYENMQVTAIRILNPTPGQRTFDMSGSINFITDGGQVQCAFDSKASELEYESEDIVLTRCGMGIFYQVEN